MLIYQFLMNTKRPMMRFMGWQKYVVGWNFSVLITVVEQCPWYHFLILFRYLFCQFHIFHSYFFQNYIQFGLIKDSNLFFYPFDSFVKTFCLGQFITQIQVLPFFSVMMKSYCFLFSEILIYPLFFFSNNFVWFSIRE